MSGYYFTPTLTTGASATSATLTSASKTKEDKGAIAAILAASEHKNKKNQVEEEDKADFDAIDSFLAQNETASHRIKIKSAASTISNDDSDDGKENYEDEEGEDAMGTNSDELVKKKVANPQLEAEE